MAEGEHVFDTDTVYRTCTRCGAFIVPSSPKTEVKPILEPYTQCEWCCSFIDLDSGEEVFDGTNEGSWYCSNRCLDAESQMWAELAHDFGF